MAVKIATRETFGKTLAELAETNENIVVLDADVASATKTSVFQGKFPERFIQCGIAEGNMASAAAGLASCGKIPVMSTFAMFASGRAFEQIRNSICYPKLNVKICATHGGITVAEDGASHQCIEDVGVMRTVPNMTVLVPSDDTSAAAALKAAIDHVGPVYVRFGRAPITVMYDRNDFKFEIGKGHMVKDGTDVSIIANGVNVEIALAAAELLAQENISAQVVDMASVKPIDREMVIECAKKTGAIVTSEEHNIIGGLGSAVCEVIAESVPVPVVRHGVNDEFGRSGKVPDLLAMYKFTAEEIVSKAKLAISLKK